ncbi:MAG: hypothetical protein HOC20_11645 [Chloroflexi bacterium]|jgi:internalin A|nr:hypothetical protein [Chloroflexota bacterium]
MIRFTGFSFLLILLIMTLGIVSCNSSTDQTEISDNEVTFMDSHLEAAIRDVIDKPAGTIYASDLEQVTMLQAFDMKISDLTGLEHCTALTMLTIGNNQINDPSPLASLTNLNMLDLSNNQISDLSSLADLKNLVTLRLDWNEITDISPLSSLTKLRSLTLNSRPGSNEIRDISPLALIESLRDVSLWNNQISDVSPLLSLPNLEMVMILQGNPLSPTSLKVHIPQMEERGVQVI